MTKDVSQLERRYSIGDLVKIAKSTFQNDGKCTKLLPTYEGPFRIVKVLGNDRYKVAPIPDFAGMKHRCKTTVASDRIQPWIHITSLANDDVDTMDDKSDDDTTLLDDDPP